jgi:hypothetical protein
VTEGVVSAALDVISAEVARQWQARAGEPSFTGMAFRLSERPAGEKIAPDVETKFKASGGDYRTMWKNESDKLLGVVGVASKGRVAQTLSYFGNTP